MRIRFMLATLCAMSVGVNANAGDIAFSSLLKEMTDLDALTRVPDPAYTCKQFSSYDQRSTDPKVLTDENWFANGDRGQHLRKEMRNGAKEWVLMDADGPGAIVRFWSANPDEAGLVRFYFDGADTPAVEIAMTDLLGGKAPFAPAPIAGEASKGWNNYLPMPYSKHCKITSSKPDFYYQINYRTYAKGTEIETFSADLAAKHASEIAAVAKALAAPDHVPQDAEQTLHDGEIAAGASIAKDIEKPGAIREVTAHVAAADAEAALRGLLLEISFDGGAPAVLTPLGDFFGAGPGANAYLALPCGVRSDGTFYAHWTMPYAKGAKIRVTNTTAVPARLTLKARAGAYHWDARSAHFHAKYRGALQIPTRPRQDWNYLTANGAGRFAGVMLNINNPVTAWWGEGDEKIYVDGEAFPSTFGTGTEDYFGYAWCSPQPFSHAYHNQPRCDGPGNHGHTSVNRFHIIDNIPFDKSFKFDMEVWHWADVKIDQSVVAYWYAKPGATDNTPAIAKELLTVPAATPMPPMKWVDGALEAEKFKVLKISGGKTETQQSAEWPWSRGEQLWWTQAKPGDTLDLSFRAKKDARYELRAVFTKAADYGICKFRVNGKDIGEKIDFHNDGVIVTPEIVLGTAELKKGANTFSVEIVGKNDKAIPGYMFGLDYLLLKQAD